MSQADVIAVGNRRIVWRLRECMTAAGIMTTRELHKKLHMIDPDCVQYTQLARMTSPEPPARLNLRTLVALTIALKCQITDVLDVGADNQPNRS